MSTQKSSHMTRREEATPMIIIHDRLIFSIRNFPCPLAPIESFSLDDSTEMAFRRFFRVERDDSGVRDVCKKFFRKSKYSNEVFFEFIITFNVTHKYVEYG